MLSIPMFNRLIHLCVQKKLGGKIDFVEYNTLASNVGVNQSLALNQFVNTSIKTNTLVLANTIIGDYHSAAARWCSAQHKTKISIIALRDRTVRALQFF